MRLLVITVSAPYGPAEAFAAPELRAIRALGHHVTVAPLRPRGAMVHREFGVAADEVLLAPLLSPRIVAVAFLEAVRRPRTIIALVRLLAGTRSGRNLVKNLLVLPKGLWLGRQARAAGIDHIHAYWATTPATAAVIAAAVARVDFSLTAHAADIDEGNLLVAKGRRATVLRVISRDGERKVLAAGVPPGVVRLVRLGVEVPVDPAPKASPTARLVVLVPAALHPMKGHADLLEAVHQLLASSPAVDLELHLAGSGPLDAELRRRARELGVAHAVTFLGQLSHEDLLARYRDASVDVVALASVSETGRMAAEGIPVSLMEAMSYGVPVVAADSGGVSELVDGTTGLLVAMRRPAELGAALRSLALDPDLRRRIGAAGRDRVRADFDVQRTVIELVAAMSAREPHPQIAIQRDHLEDVVVPRE